MAMLVVNERIQIPGAEIEFTAVRSQGPGGQNVNKVASAAHLRFDIRKSSLPHNLKEKLLALSDHRVTSNGVIVIKAQQSRSQQQNREFALNRLAELVRRAGQVAKKRKATKLSRTARERRLKEKTRRSRIKSLRGRVGDND